MGGVWGANPDGGWRPLPASGFTNETELHDLIEQTPEMLPLAGSPTLAVLGREVRCGRGLADLLAVETSTGRPVIIELKLAANTDRRQVLTQVLGYAAYLRRLDVGGFTQLVSGHLQKRQLASVEMAARAAAQDPSFDAAEFEAGLDSSLREGRVRCVVVLDAVPADVLELVGYLQEVTNDHLSLDAVCVTSYDIGNRRVLVPRLVEPDLSQITAASAGLGVPPSTSEINKGGAEFAAAIDEAPADQQAELRRLFTWAAGVEEDGLAVLYTSKGKGRWVLNLRLPGQERGMVVLWNENGAFLSPYRTVFLSEAPMALDALDAKAPGQIGQGNYIKCNYDDALLALLRAAYVEAAGGGG